ncbi:ParA family protein [Vibrio coralliirubri]|jgi:chromosome partitioning protein|uniref:ParA family protein n=1 Tax=Vibrio coralliirubri TaxID=1516159 RepID=UPI0023EB60BE|nr:ParA family protein [Vibrio parahaemolyticus]
MGKVISFANSKGGVGKTTSCLTTGCCLAELGYSVLLVDLDHQGNLSDDVGRGDEDYTITDLFENPKYDTNDLVYPALSGEEVIPNLDVIPADITLAVEARSAERYRHRLQILEDGLSRLKKHYDFILIDCRPAIDLSIENAFLLTDLVVIPVDMDRRATKGISDLLEVIKEIKRSEAFDSIVLKTKIDKRNKVMLRSTYERLEGLGLPIAETEIRITEDYKKATDNHMPVTHFSDKSKSIEDYRSFTNELLSHVGQEGARFDVRVMEGA